MGSIFMFPQSTPCSRTHWETCASLRPHPLPRELISFVPGRPSNVSFANMFICVIPFKANFKYKNKFTSFKWSSTNISIFYLFVLKGYYYKSFITHTHTHRYTNIVKKIQTLYKDYYYKSFISLSHTHTLIHKHCKKARNTLGDQITQLLLRTLSFLNLLSLAPPAIRGKQTPA